MTYRAGFAYPCSTHTTLLFSTTLASIERIMRAHTHTCAHFQCKRNNSVYKTLLLYIAHFMVVNARRCMKFSHQNCISSQANWPLPVRWIYFLAHCFPLFLSLHFHLPFIHNGQNSSCFFYYYTIRDI